LNGEASRTLNRGGFPWPAVAAPVFTVVFNDTMFSVALPTLMEEFSIGARTASWGITGYVIAVVLFMTGAGRLGDRLGRALTYRLAVGTFIAGSLATAAAPDFGWLMAGRVLQGLGAAAIFPVALALVVEHNEGARRLFYLGRCEAAIPAGALAGPLLGGGLIQVLGWRGSLLVIAGICLAAIGLLRRLPATSPKPETSDTSFDWWGGAGVFGFLLCLLLIVTLPGIMSQAKLAGLLALGVLACMGLVVLRSRTVASPYVPAHLLTDGRFWAAGGSIFLSMFLGFGITLAGPIYLGQVRGLGPFIMGMIVFPRPLSQLLTTPLGARLASRVGPRWPVAVGMTGSGLSLAVLALGVIWGWDWLIVAAMATFGMARGLCPAACAGAASESFRAGEAGAGSALYQTCRYAGALFGAAVVGKLLEWRQSVWVATAAGSIAGGTTGGAADILPYRDVFLLLAALGLLSLLLVLGLPRGRKAAAAGPTGGRNPGQEAEAEVGTGC